jgi:HlyD family secretion protein
MRFIVLLVVIAALGGGGWWWYSAKSAEPAAEYRTAKVSRGDLVSTIGATGTLEPEEVIDVGAQVTAQIVSFGKDLDGKSIDYGSKVQKDMELARLDDVVYAASVTESEAQLAQAKAGVLKAKADLGAATAKLYSAQRDWERAERIGPSDALAQSAYDNYKSTWEQAKANVDVMTAAVSVADATVKQSDSALKRAQRNLNFTVITSPVSGTVIDRRVNIGQTVTSNLSVASLFLIARDLTKMQVWVSVNEADIGSIRPQQPVTFTVDAFPGDTFKGVVRKIRPNATMTSNVVTYIVEVDTDNANLRLIPYLTANVQFEVTRRDDVLMVPNAALRWAPAGSVSREDRQSPSSTTRPARDGGRKAKVWVKDGPGVKSIDVQAGVTDGTNTEIRGDGVSEDLEVVTGEVTTAGGSNTAKNPFVPQMPGRRRP